MNTLKKTAALLTGLLAEAAKACQDGAAQFHAIAKRVNLQPQ